MNEFNFVHEDINQKDIELFMGPLEPEVDGPFIKFGSNWTMAHIMHAAGIFKSVNEARKNGWNKPIQHGFQHIVATKRKINIFILNEFLEDTPHSSIG